MYFINDNIKNHKYENFRTYFINKIYECVFLNFDINNYQRSFGNLQKSHQCIINYIREFFVIHLLGP
ncbi:hypothetical protein GHA01_11220 [Novacetimonas hansenii]|uniref:Uncharacterized protein n=1 Tax=Novacetimonas hansenii TaxID=436 RepID=A0ABQ0SDP5_NOVHA|nr:hypothetical protein Gaha_0188_022 [Novacetimonas hansenii JCM 7643]GEC63273.1 hypothetical protein GHA01_11220 [Novacetimonas hansenii]